MRSLSPLLGLLLASLSLSNSPAQDTPAPEPSSVDQATLKKWRDARFGMFIHWGPISQKAMEISWSRGNPIPIEEYDNLYKTFDPVKFDAAKWVSVAKAAGAKYIVLTCKHHDGFCLWATKQTDYNIMNTPFKRDVVKELSDACHKQGMNFGCYYSTTDWHNPDFPLTSPGGNVHREHSDLEAYTRYLKAQIKELLTNYGPIFTLWFDFPQEFDAARGQSVIDFARSIQPNVIINNRTGAAGDYDTPEQNVGGFNRARPWESCMTISAHNAWAWGGDADGVKSLDTIIKMLVYCAGGDGNMLLNVGPQPNGEINAQQIDRMQSLGKWTAKYGESIYGTRGGPFKPSWWGASTCTGNTIYLHILSWKKEPFVLPPIGPKILKSKLLSDGEVKVKQNAQGISISVAPSDRQDIDTVVKLSLDSPAFAIPPSSYFSGSVAVGKTATASNTYQNDSTYAPGKAFDDDKMTRWATDAGTTKAWLQVDLGQPTKISRAQVEEALGPRIQSFELQYKDGDQWKTFYTGTTMGDDFQVPSFPPFTAQVIRLNILKASEGPTISEFELFSNP